MTVRKLENKVSRVESQRGKLELSPELKKIREMISTLPPEGEDNMTTENPDTAKGPKKVTKKAAAKKSKVTKKSNGAAEGTSLKTICKPLKMEPRRARRILRTAKVKNPGRWNFTSAADVNRVTKLLKSANE